MRNLPDKSSDTLQNKYGINPGADAGEEDRHVHARTS